MCHITKKLLKKKVFPSNTTLAEQTKKIAEYKQYIFLLHMSTQLFLLNKYDIDNVSIIQSLH